MNLTVLISGLLQIVLSLVIGAFFIFLAYKLFMKMTRNIDEMEEIKKKNTAVGILVAGMILAVAIQISAAVESTTDVLQIFMRDTHISFVDYIKNTGYIFGHILISGVIAFFGVFFAIQLFMWMTRDIDEMAHIKDNNVAVAIIIAVIMVSMALLLRPGISTILDSLIPFPTRGTPLEGAAGSSALNLGEMTNAITNSIAR